LTCVSTIVKCVAFVGLLDGFNLLLGWLYFLLWLQDGNDIWVLELWSVESGLIVRLQNLDLHAKHTLSEEDVSNSGVDVLSYWVTTVDHHTVNELHGFGTLTTDFTADDDFAAASTLLHDESKNTVGGSSDGQASEQFVAEGLGLGNGGKTAVGNSLDVKIDLALLVAPSLVDNSGEFPDSTGLLAQHLTWSGSDDDDLAGLALSDDDSTVAVLGELSLEELVEFGLEETVAHEEVLLGDWPGLRLGLFGLSCHIYCDVFKLFFVIFCKFDLRL